MTAETTLTRPGTVLTIAARLPPDAAPGRSLPMRVVDAPPPPVARGSGFLTVTTDPSATALLDGDCIGVPPPVAPARAGRVVHALMRTGRSRD